MYRSVITTLLGSICSRHLRSVTIIFVGLVEELEHFPWGVVNNLIKLSPHILQSVDLALRMLERTDGGWGRTSPLSCDEYEVYFHQVRSALPELDKRVTTRIASKAVRHQPFGILTS
jgi:hypothetical protein